MTTTLAPKIIGGRYQLINLLGSGAMGEVYQVHDMLMRQQVALKRVLIQPLPEDLQDSLELVDRQIALTREFQTLASLRHSNIISVLDYGFDQDHYPYFTMDLLDNPQTILTASVGKSLAGKVRLLVQVLQALAYLHRRGILHRDLKPGNILVVNGQVKVVDFGLAWAQPSTADSRVVGTLAYMPPEVLLGEPLTSATDLYAVGVIAYEIIAGRHPFRLDEAASLVASILDTQPDMKSLLESIPADTESAMPDTEPSAETVNPDTVDMGRVKTPTQIIFPSPTERLPDELYLPDASQAEKTLKVTFDADLTMHFDLVQEQLIGKQPVADSAKGTQQFEDYSIAAVIARLLNKRPYDRYQDANTVIRALSNALHEPLPAESTAIRESFLQAARFVGREAEFAKLDTALGEAVAGQGSTWLIGGESGVGKSRLVDELRIQALVSETRVVRGQGILNGQAYEIWREPVRHLVLNTPLPESDLAVLETLIPDLDALLNRHTDPTSEKAAHSDTSVDPEQAQKRLLEVIVSLINRQTQPLVIILEDLQWVHGESLALIEQLSQFIDKSSLLIVGTYRNDETPQLPSTLPMAKTLQLNRLSQAAVAELSASMLGQAGIQPQVLDLLQRETEGNVFFLIETVRALAEEAGQLDLVGVRTLPKHVFTGGIGQIIQRRLSRVAPADFPLLQLAAVLGRQISVEVLRTEGSIADVEAWLLRAADNSLLEIRDEQWRFSHDKIREGIIDALSDSERVTLHRKAAESIEATYSDGKLSDYAPALADHWCQANEPQKEQQAVTLAGDRALLLGAHQEAITYFERALELLPTLPALSQNKSLQVDLMLKLASSRIYAGLYAEATAGLTEALKLSTEVTDQRLTAQSYSLLGQAAMHRGEFEEAARYINQSQPLFKETGDQQGLANNFNVLGRLAYYQGKYEEASAHFMQSLAIFRQINNTIGAAKALGGLGNTTIAKGDPAQAVDYLQESLLAYQNINFRNGIGSAMLALSNLSLMQGKSEEANTYLRQALITFREISAPAELAAAINNLGYIAMMQQSYKESQDWFEEGLAINRRIGDQWGTTNILVNLGHVATKLKATTHAVELFNEAGHGAKALGAVPLLLEILIGLATVDAQAGNYTHAAELFGMVMAQPGLDSNIKSLAEPLLIELQAALPTEILTTAIERGKSQELKTVVDAVFA